MLAVSGTPLEVVLQTLPHLRLLRTMYGGVLASEGVSVGVVFCENHRNVCNNHANMLHLAGTSLDKRFEPKNCSISCCVM